MHLAFICQTFFFLRSRWLVTSHGKWPGAIRFNAEVAPLRQTTGNGIECLTRTDAGLEYIAPFTTGTG